MRTQRNKAGFQFNIPGGKIGAMLSQAMDHLGLSEAEAARKDSPPWEEHGP